MTWKVWGIGYDEPAVYVDGQNLRGFLSTFRHDPQDALFGPNSRGGNYFYSAFESLFFNVKGKYYYEHFHAANLLFAALIFACFFILLWKQYQNALIALGGTWLLVLTPRFFGGIPLNPRDVPFTVVFFIGLTAIFLKRDWGSPLRRFLFLGALFGVVSCDRLVGLTLFPILFLFDFYEKWATPASPLPGGRVSRGWSGWFAKECLYLIPAFIASQLCMAALWPYLRVDYFNHLFQVLGMAKEYGWNGLTWFMGHGVWATGYPWYYLPIWFLVTIPISTLAFFLFSFWAFKGRPGNRASTGLYALFFISFSTLSLMYLVLKPVIYNAERHFTFLMVIVIFMGYLGMVEFFRMKISLKWKGIAALVLALNAVSVAVQMVRLHPYEYTYFNELTGGVHGAYRKFEMEYWGASLKEAAEWLRDNECTDPRRIYKVESTGNPWSSMYYYSKNMVSLKADYQGGDADYFLFHPMCDQKLRPDQVPKLIHTVEREGVPLTYVLKLR